MVHTYLRPPLLLNLSGIIKFLHLCDWLLHNLLNQPVILTFVNLLYTVRKMLGLRCNVFSCKPPCQNTYVGMGDTCGTSYGTAAAADTVEGFLRALLELSPLGICDIVQALHPIQL